MSLRDPARVVVRRPMNDHGTVTVELPATNETRHVCEYATPDLRRRLAALPPGGEILVSLSRVGGRANVWRAVAAADPGPEPAGADRWTRQHP